MKFIEENETNEKFYSVEYDKEKLIEILEKLKEYSPDFRTLCIKKSSFNPTFIRVCDDFYLV